MPTTDPERARRGKNLVIYGMFSLVLVTFLSSFLVLAVLMKKIDPTFFDGAAIARMALVPSLIITGIAIAACIAGWIVYTRVILNE